MRDIHRTLFCLLYSIMSNIKIALFVCDVPSPEVTSQFGEYPDLFRKLFSQATKDLNENISFEIQNFDVTESVYPSEEDLYAFDLVIITGSKEDAHGDADWVLRLQNYIREIMTHPAHRKPKLFGVCFGHQLIGQAFGAKSDRNPKGWEVGWTKLDLNEEGKKWFGLEQDYLNIHEMHQDQMVEVPANFKLLASSDMSRNQIMLSMDNRIIAVQGHPEYDSDLAKVLITSRRDKGQFSEEQATTWLSRVNNPNNGSLILQRVIQWLKE